MPKYYKAFRGDLTGWNDYQFESGKTFTDEEGLYYADTISTCLITYHEPDTRIFEVAIDKPCYKCIDAVHGSVAYQAKSITLTRELSRAEIADILIQERCPLERAVRLGLDFEALKRFPRQKLDYSQRHTIQTAKTLSHQEKAELIALHKTTWFR
jgi:hypothetical protein